MTQNRRGTLRRDLIFEPYQDLLRDDDRPVFVQKDRRREFRVLCFRHDAGNQLANSIGALRVASYARSSYSDADVEFLLEVSQQLSLAVRNLMAITPGVKG